jgi:3-phosphoglycerate kinase
MNNGTAEHGAEPRPGQGVIRVLIAGAGVIESLRFNAGETSKDDATRGAFADQFAALADLYVSDGFGVLHRKQAARSDNTARIMRRARSSSCVASAKVRRIRLT